MDLDVGAGRPDPARDVALAAAIARVRRADDRGRGVVLLFAFVLIGIPVGGMAVALAIGGILAIFTGDVASGTGAFLLGGLALLGAAPLVREFVRDLWLRLRVGARVDAPAYACLGEAMPVRIRLRGRLLSARWELCHVERSGQRRIRHTSKGQRETTEWAARSRTWDEGPLASGLDHTVTVRVPVHAPAPALGESREIDWELRVHLETAVGTRSVTVPITILPVTMAAEP